MNASADLQRGQARCGDRINESGSFFVSEWIINSIVPTPKPGALTTINGYDVELVERVTTPHPGWTVKKISGKQNAVDSETKRWIEAALANDEASSDAELIAHFMKEGGLSRSEAESWVAKRDKYLRGEI